MLQAYPLFKMLFSLVVLGILGFTLGDDPQPCCYSNQWQGKMYQQGASLPSGSAAPIIQIGYLNMDYDYDNKKMLIESHIEDPVSGVLGNVTVLEDFNKHKRYIITGSTCNTELIPPVPMQSPCVPANYTFLDSYTLGGGASSFKVNMFRGKLPLGLRATIHLTADGGCVPVSQSMEGDTGTARVLTSYTFGNVMKGSSNAHQFTVPSSCTQTGSAVGKRSAHAEHLIQQLRTFA